jgi:hypothetical protein
MSTNEASGTYKSPGLEAMAAAVDEFSSAQPKQLIELRRAPERCVSLLATAPALPTVMTAHTGPCGDHNASPGSIHTLGPPYVEESTMQRGERVSECPHTLTCAYPRREVSGPGRAAYKASVPRNLHRELLRVLLRTLYDKGWGKGKNTRHTQ